MKNLIVALVLITAVSGCKNSTVVSTDELGTLRGKVLLYGVNCDSLSDRSGAAVRLEGTNFIAMTDATGQWIIEHIPAGIYNVIASKPEFDTDLTSEYQIIGAGTQFLEHEVLYSIAVPLDSILMTSLSIARGGVGMDSNRFPFTMIFTMNGPDPVISCSYWIKDSTRHRQFQEGGFSITRNQTIRIDTAVWGYEQPTIHGDSVWVLWQAHYQCGRPGPIFSRGAVMP